MAAAVQRIGDALHFWGGRLAVAESLRSLNLGAEGQQLAHGVVHKEHAVAFNLEAPCGPAVALRRHLVAKRRAAFAGVRGCRVLQAKRLDGALEVHVVGRVLHRLVNLGQQFRLHGTRLAGGCLNTGLDRLAHHRRCHRLCGFSGVFVRSRGKGGGCCLALIPRRWKIGNALRRISRCGLVLSVNQLGEVGLELGDFLLL